MPEQEKKERRHSNVFFKLLVAVLMIVIIVLLLLQRCEKPEDTTMEASIKARLGQLENKSQAEIQAELNRIIEEGMFHVAINSDPVFSNGAAEGNLEIENVPNNLYSMRVEIKVDETDEVVYDSGLIDPNYHVQRDNLQSELAAGVYPSTATFYAYDMTTLEEIGTVSVKITIHVLN